MLRPPLLLTAQTAAKLSSLGTPAEFECVPVYRLAIDAGTLTRWLLQHSSRAGLDYLASVPARGAFYPTRGRR